MDDDNGIGERCPRDCREEAFRKHEQVLGEACINLAANCAAGVNAMYTIKISDVPLTPGYLVRTYSVPAYANRLRAARKGYKRFHYASVAIPTWFDLDWLEFRETVGTVLILVKADCYAICREASLANLKIFGPA